MYTYYIPNQWRTRLKSISPGLTHYIHCGDTYIGCYHNQLEAFVAKYREMGWTNVETGELLNSP